MTANFIKCFFMAAVLAAPCGSVLAATDNGNGDSLNVQCSKLVQECFTYSEHERINCFHSAATHPFCDGTTLGKLTLKRWSMTPLHAQDSEPSAALLGPQAVNGACLNAFDNQWSAKISKGEISEEELSQLQLGLDDCRKNIQVELPRP